MTTLTFPFPPAYVTGLLWLIGIAILAMVIAFSRRIGKQSEDALILKSLNKLALAPLILIIFAALIWAAIFLLTLIGVGSAIHDIIVFSVIDDPDMQSNWRGAVIKLAALTSVLGAIITLPITLWRTSISNVQNDNASATLFNTKFNAASTALAARRTVTFTARNVAWIQDGETHSHLECENTPFTPPDDATNITRSAWEIHAIEEPDIVTRSTAIDQIEQLVHERPSEAPRVANLLSIYVREHTAEVPPEPVPKGTTIRELRDWAYALNPKRNDVQKAAQSLGHLKDIPKVIPDDIQIDLRDANLQGFDLSDRNFDDANLSGAQLQGANLSGAQLQGANL